MRQCSNSILQDSTCGCFSTCATKTGENPKQISLSKHCFSVTRNQGRSAKLWSRQSQRWSQSRQAKYRTCQSSFPRKQRSLTFIQVPQEVCGHSALKTPQGRKPKAQKQTGKQKPSPKKVKARVVFLLLTYKASSLPGAFHVSQWSSTTTEAVRE